MASLVPNEFPAIGEKSWLCPGLNVFSLTKPDNRKTPRAHRFAIKTSPDFTGRCNPLKLGKYYIHAYQARFLVGDHGRSLNSRAMPYNLSNMFPDRYHPRGRDLANTTSRQEERVPDEPSRPNNQGTIPPMGMPTPFVPLANLPRQYPIPGIGPYGFPYLQQPMMMNNYTQPAFMPPVPIQPTMHPWCPTPTNATMINPSRPWNTAAPSNFQQTHNAPMQRLNEDPFANRDRGRPRNLTAFHHPQTA